LAPGPDAHLFAEDRMVSVPLAFPFVSVRPFPLFLPPMVMRIGQSLQRTLSFIRHPFFFSRLIDARSFLSSEHSLCLGCPLSKVGAPPSPSPSSPLRPRLEEWRQSRSIFTPLKTSSSLFFFPVLSLFHRCAAAQRFFIFS